MYVFYFGITSSIVVCAASLGRGAGGVVASLRVFTRITDLVKAQ